MVYEAQHEFRYAPINMDNKYTAGNSDEGSVRRLSGMQWQKLLNLLGNSETVSANRLTVQFTKDACLIRDPTLRTMIGVGKRRNGLYYFCSIPKALMFHVDGKESPVFTVYFIIRSSIK
ncbi:hypothetical protein LIER_27482 [Lithospermum erythrorhizon]|uniref:Uncharacterized protein n=1 Tax=Lithospermum erythrorhizon TaxID=34254 RepID=A0AAV3RI70_LITER